MCTALTMFLVPAYAIVAELTANYDERTRLLGAMAINVVPISLRLLGFFSENGSGVLFWIMLAAGFSRPFFSWCSTSAGAL